jgi:hypothetical protein
MERNAWIRMGTALGLAVIAAPAAPPARAQPRAGPAESVEDRRLAPAPERSGPPEAGETRGPDRERGAHPVRPRPAADRRLGASPLAGGRASDRPATWLARIDSLSLEQGPVGGVSAGVLAPGCIVTAFGVGFGDAPGTMEMRAGHGEIPELPAGVVPTRVLEWTDTHVRAELPAAGQMTGPLHRTSVHLVVRPADGRPSPPYPAEFEVPAELREVGSAAVSASVSAIECSDAGNDNACAGDRVHARHANVMVPHNPFDTDTGIDRWEIRLFDGWVFHDSKLRIRDGLVALGSPPPEAGGTTWIGEIDWKARLAETAEYEFEVEVKRARTTPPLHQAPGP